MGLSKDAISSGQLGTSFNPQVQRGTSLDIRTYSVLNVSGRVISDQFGVNLLAAQ